MIGTATSLALITTAGAYFIYDKFPRRIKKLVVKYSLLSDILAFIGVYMILGGTLTALFAASIMGCMVSAMLHVANHKNDYLYLYDMHSFIKEKLAEAKVALNTYGEAYRENKLTA